MAASLFCPNQVICFQTNYFKNRHNLTGYRYYLLKEVDKKNNLLIFFSITSNRTREWVLYSQHKVKQRPICLDSKKYSDSFINTNCLIKVPLEVTKFLERNCQKLHQTCLDKEEFREIINLHKFVVEFQSILRVDVEIINLTEKNFTF
jgi:hypothetical protein